jgi:hypothetical protein
MTMLCAWQEPHTKGNCQVTASVKPFLPITTPFSGFPAENWEEGPLPTLTGPIPCPLVGGSASFLQTVLPPFLVCRETVGHPWSVLTGGLGGSSKWVSSAGA